MLDRHGSLNRKGITFIAVLTLIAVAAIVIGYFFAPMEALMRTIDPSALGSWVREHGLFGVLVFVLSGAATVSIGLPRQIVALIAGYSFGVWQGVALAICSVTIGAAITFYFARCFARPWVRQRYADVVTGIDAFARDQPFLKILAIRFLPIGTNMLTNLAAGTSGMFAITFLTASMIGFLPQTAIFVLAGHGLQNDSFTQLISAAVLFAGLTLCVIVYRKAKRKRASVNTSGQAVKLYGRT